MKIGYKVLNNDMTSLFGDMQYELGKIYEYDKKIELNGAGYHFGKTIDSVVQYNYYGSSLFEAEILGDVVSNNDSESGFEYACTNKIKLIREITEDEIKAYANSFDINTAIMSQKVLMSRYGIKLEDLVNDSEFSVRCAVAYSRYVPVHMLEKLSNDSFNFVRAAVTVSPNVTKELLEKLSNDPCDFVKDSATEKINGGNE